MIKGKHMKNSLMAALAVMPCLTMMWNFQASAAVPRDRQEKADAAKCDSLVVMPWNGRVSWTESTGSFLSVSGEALEGRMQGDLMNRLTGAVPGLEIVEKAGFALPNYQYRTLDSDRFSVRMRGRGNVMCIVNDACIPFGQLQLDPNQIESMTFLTDVADRARYGVLASDGAILIKTKSGSYNTPMRISVNAESGVGFADRVSEWVNGVDYAKLNNAAREESDYEQLYSQLAIRNFEKCDPYSSEYPNVDYKSLMFRDFRPGSSAGLNIFGGTSGVRYNFSLSGLWSGDLIKSTKSVDHSRVNFTAGLGVKVGKYMEVSVDFSSMLYFRHSGRTSWYDYRSVPAVAYPLELELPDGAGTAYGVSKSWTQNYYALMNEGGFRTNRMRSGLMDVALDVDLSWLLKGLKSRTWLAASNFAQTTIGKNDDYIAWYWSSDAGIQEQSSHKGAKASGKSTLSNYTWQSMSMYERLSYEGDFGQNHVSAGATFSMNSASSKTETQNQRQMYVVADAKYSYADRYVAELVAQYAGSSRYEKGHRFAFFPSAGLAWVASNEDFLRDVNWIDRLKLHAQTGITGQFDVFGTPYQYRSNYSYNGDMWYGPISDQPSWFGTNRWISYKTTINRLANHNLSWPKVFQTDLGIDFDFLSLFSFKVNAYYKKIYDSIVNVSSIIPGVYGLNNISLMDNYTSQSLRGMDVTFGYSQTFGDFRVGASLSATMYKAIYEKMTDDNWLYEYQKKTGTPVDAYWGYRCIGKYEDEDQLSSVPAISTAVKVGDLMYEDVNNDGRIDDNDKVNLGNTAPRLSYALNFTFGWKNLELNVVGTGRAGLKTAMTNSYFWNGWGDGNYSAFVRDNIGGAYPRLDYVHSDQNFVGSDFWLRNGSWFKIQSVELSYDLNLRPSSWIKGIKFSLKGQNLLTLSGIKDVDPECIDAGVTSYPLLRSVTGGVKLNF